MVLAAEGGQHKNKAQTRLEAHLEELEKRPVELLALLHHLAHAAANGHELLGLLLGEAEVGLERGRLGRQRPRRRRTVGEGRSRGVAAALLGRQGGLQGRHQGVVGLGRDHGAQLFPAVGVDGREDGVERRAGVGPQRGAAGGGPEGGPRRVKRGVHHGHVCFEVFELAALGGDRVEGGRREQLG